MLYIVMTWGGPILTVFCRLATCRVDNHADHATKFKISLDHYARASSRINQSSWWIKIQSRSSTFIYVHNNYLKYQPNSAESACLIRRVVGSYTYRECNARMNE